MPEHPPPETYDDLLRIIRNRFAKTSKGYQTIAIYITQNPNDVAVLAVNTIAEKCGVHSSGIVRYAQSLGYKGFKEMQAVFLRRLATAAPSFEARVTAQEHARGKVQGKAELLQDLVVRDIAALEELLTTIDPTALETAARLMQAADTIYLAAELRAAPVVELLRYILTMLGKRSLLLDKGGGLATHMAKLATGHDLLLVVSFSCAPADVIPLLAENTSLGVPIVAITGATLSPLAKAAQVVFCLPEHDTCASPRLAAAMCLAQGLCRAMASIGR